MLPTVIYHNGRFKMVPIVGKMLRSERLEQSNFARRLRPIPPLVKRNTIEIRVAFKMENTKQLNITYHDPFHIHLIKLLLL